MNKRKNHVLWYLLFGFLYLLGTSTIVLCSWYHKTYNVGFKELLYTLLGPLEGTGNSVIRLVVNSFVPPFIFCLALLVVGGFLLSETRLNQMLWTRILRRDFPRRIMCYLRRTAALGCTAVFLFSLYFLNVKFDVLGYVESLQENTYIYETEYADPATVAISAPEKKRNLIHIYVESLETTYMSTEEGGLQEANMMPCLTELADEHLNFAGPDTPSGMRSMAGLGWTMASLLGHTAGIPFAFPVDGNAMDTQDTFAPNLVTLGDILEENGYAQEFLCGSDASFAGRRKYFTEHGNYQIYDLFTAREQGVIEEDYYVWWGFEDFILFDIAKEEAARLAEGDQPFNLTLLTVDLHHTGGYFCDMCDTTYAGGTGDVVHCTDWQVAEFVAWCQEQPFYQDTTIIITGDHPRMDTMLVDDAADYQRTMYNCILNEAAEVEGSSENRVFTVMDMFPTTLAAMGFEIEGDRLGLGVNLFSTQKTLAERMGMEALELELNKHSAFYLNRFFYNK